MEGLRKAKITASRGGARRTPQKGMRMPRRMGPSRTAHHGTLVVRWRRYGPMTRPSRMTMRA